VFDGGPLVRPDGVIAFERDFDLVQDAGALLAPLEIGINGKPTAGSAWTGAPAPGVAGTTMQTCDSWSNVSLTGATANLNDSAPGWSNWLSRACTDQYNLICIGP
jgi:hypothetical protein